jgi:DNA-binding NtrC family response regulator
MAKVLIVDDDEDMVKQYEEALAGTGHALTVAYSAAQTRDVLKGCVPEVAVVDIMMDNGIPGFDLAREIHLLAPDAPILMVSSLNSELKASMDTTPDEKLPIHKFLDKPVAAKTLVEEIRRALEAAGKKARKK